MPAQPCCLHAVKVGVPELHDVEDFDVAMLTNAWLSASIIDGKTTNKPIVIVVMIIATIAQAMRGAEDS
jgi:hypothetical protein